MKAFSLATMRVAEDTAALGLCLLALDQSLQSSAGSILERDSPSHEHSKCVKPCVDCYLGHWTYSQVYEVDALDILGAAGPWR